MEDSQGQPKKRRGPYKRYLIGMEVPKTTRRRYNILTSTTLNNDDHEISVEGDTDRPSSGSSGTESKLGSSSTTTRSTSDSDNNIVIDNVFHVSDGLEPLDWTTECGMSMSETEAEAEEGFPTRDDDFADDESDVSDCEDEENCYNHNQAESDEAIRLLYPGCRLTLAMSMMLILTFVTRHDLTGAALKDLLILVELHCAVPNICRQSYKLYNHFFANLKGPVEFHYFCCFCETYHGQKKSEVCQQCKNNSIEYFIYLPIISQLTVLFERQDILDLINYPQNRKKQSMENIEDVYDGSWYKTHFKDGYFRNSTTRQKEHETHISFQLNTDGVSLFKSSTYSVWPIYLTINELQPNLRFSSSNRLFVGLWFGKQKPKMNVFFTPLKEELMILYSKGMKVVRPNWTTTLRCLLLCTVCDAPARCSLQNFVQFNGYNGCPFCVIKGESVKTAKGGNTMTYPYDCNNPTIGHPDLRTHKQTLLNAKEAVKSGKTVNGVKGFSLLCNLPNFDIIKSTAIDYMHLMLLGVTKMFIHLWTDTSSNGEQYYLGNKMDLLNNRISQIKPPKQITRVPRCLNDLAHWKASEYRNFLLFFSIPCLWGILPNEFFVHWVLYVEATYILLQTSISPKELEKARLNLCKFCASIDTLYLQRNMLSNVHGLLHICQKVMELGPLWAQSCFFYEDLNGDLRKLFHGTQNIDAQIITAVRMQQSLTSVVKQFEPGSEAERLYKKMTHSMEHENKTTIKHNTFAIGNFNMVLLGEELLNMIPDSVAFNRFYQFYRLLKDKVMIHSQAYTAVSRRDTTCVVYGNGKKFGSVAYYLKGVHESKVEFYAVINSFDSMLMDFDFKLPVHIKSFRNSGKREVVPVEQILRPCVNVKFQGMPYFFCALFPNMIEKD